MKLIVEGYHYKADDVGNLLQDIEPLYNKDGSVKVDFVGYFYNNNIKDCIFFLPKVVLNEQDLVLNQYKPEDIINVGDFADMERKDKDFIYGLSVWIYRAVKEYQRLNPQSEIVYLNRFSRIDGSNTKVTNTLIDVVLSLLRFNNENRDFVMFTLRNIHSGYNKINWTRTISKHRPLLQNGNPVYLNLVNRKKQVNFDEELLIIFYSILNYIRDKYGFKTNIDCNYELITGPMFDHWMRGYGKLRLREIKYKYFSDKALALWKHCYAFFELSELINSTRQQSDYLLVKNFNIVFEAIIDELLSDKELKRGDLVDQPDGKRVDHMYAYNGLINDNERIYYIGDSKYYKLGNEIPENSVYKQYTYARNVIQYNLKLFLDNAGEPGKDYLIYRDPETEGYNITPNFFISARLNEEYSYTDNDLTFNGDQPPMKHFENRLFDRDTLLLQRYDVNFLFVLSLFAGANEYAKQEFKRIAQAKFREKIISYLDERYQFFSLQKKSSINAELGEIVNKHFRNIIGKSFRPYSEDDMIYVSLECDDKYVDDNTKLLSSLSVDFDIREYKLGTDPREEINHFVQIESNYNSKPNKSILLYKDYSDEIFLLGGYRLDKEHWKWITDNNLYNIRYGSMRNGAVDKKHINSQAISARYLILYNIDEPNNKVEVFRIEQHHVYNESQMKQRGYPNPTNGYFVYTISEKPFPFERLNVTKLFEDRRMELVEEARKAEINSEDYIEQHKGEPLFFKGNDLLKYTD